MSWFQSTNLASFAKTALKEAQKTIDKALEIKEESERSSSNSSNTSSGVNVNVNAVTEAATDFFASWGVSVSSKKQEKPSSEDDSNNYNVTGKKSSLNTSKTNPSLSSEVPILSGNGPNHKRSLSLDTSPTSKNHTLQDLSTGDMHRSLTSDIPVTLVAAPSSPTTFVPYSNSTEHGQPEDDHLSTAFSSNHNNISLSDTVFDSSSLLDDFNFNGEVQDLDGLVYNHPHHDSLFNSSTSTPNAAANAATIIMQQPPQPEKGEPPSLLLSDLSSHQNTIPINISEVAAQSQNQTSGESTQISDSDKATPFTSSNLDLLSTIDLDSSNSPSNLITVDLVNIPPTSVNEPLDDRGITYPKSSTALSTFPPENIGERSCDSAWSWAEAEEPEPFDSLDAIESSRLNSQQPSPSSPPPELEEVPDLLEDSKVSGFESMSSKTTTSCSQVPESLPDPRLLQQQHQELDPLILRALSYKDELIIDVTLNPPSENDSQSHLEFLQQEKEEYNNHLNTQQTAVSPPTSSISIIDSPRSPSPTEDNDKDSKPLPTFQLLPQVPEQSTTKVTESFNQPEKVETHEEVAVVVVEIEKLPEERAEDSSTSPDPQDQDLGLPTTCAGSLPESSRSSSIVVISGRNSTPSSQGSGGSDPCNLHDDADTDQSHEHEGSTGSGFERIDLPQPSNSGEEASTSYDPQLPSSSPDLVPPESKHKKGASSSSSSDIEVIPADYSSSGSARKVESTTQQTSPIPSTDAHTQTDQPKTEVEVPSKRALTVEDLPKQVTQEIADMLAEKELVIEQLREEGGKLSKKQFDLSQAVKKLRGKEKEMESMIKIFKGELAGKSLENERLMKSFIAKEGLERTQNEIISKITSEKRNLELKIEQMKSEIEDAKENCSTMKASVEEASVEILELQNAISVAQRDSTELDSITREKAELTSRNESQQKEIDHLRSTMNSIQSKTSTRESSLQSQITTLTGKLHNLESQLADVSSEVADATMPLSIQIEKLQTELKATKTQTQKRESILQLSVLDLESKLKTVADREQMFKESSTNWESKFTELESLSGQIESENQRLRTQLSVYQQQEGKLKDDKSNKISSMESQIKRLIGEVERLNRENDSLGMELKSEKITADQERKRSQSLMEQLSNSTLSRSYIQNNSSSMNHGGGGNGNLPKSGENSPSSNSIVSEVSYLDEVFDPNGHLVNPANRSMTPKSFFESFSSAGLLEGLQTQLRQREAELHQFQDEGSKNEKIRKTLNEEIAKLTMQNQEFQIEMERLNELETRLGDMEKNYNAILQMYGEKVEEAEELRMDLQDVKDMYKVQIEQLLKK